MKMILYVVSNELWILNYVINIFDKGYGFGFGFDFC